MRFVGCLSAACVALAAPALAQTALPGSAEPGQIERRFEAPETPLSRGTGVSTPDIPGIVAPEGAEDATFTLRELIIEGATAFTPQDFLPLYRDRLDTKVSVETLYELAAAITARYTAAGYVLSQAVVPPQKINGDGVVRLRVVEGYVDKVVIHGDIQGPESLLRAYGDKIAAERPLRLATLERYLLLASDLPGVTASGTLAPSAAAPGAADLVFEVSHKAVDAAASLDNRGSRYVGPWQATGAVSLNSALGMYERTSLLAATTPFQPEELKYGRLSHEQIVGAEGTKVSADVGHVVAHPGYTLKPLEVRSRSTVFGLGLEHPLVRSRSENLTVRTRAEARDVRTHRNASTLIAKDSIRALRLGATYDWIDTWTARPAISLVSLELSQGFNVLGARASGSDTLSVAGGHSDFFKATVEASRTQRLGGPFSVLLGVTGQWAGATLLSAEQFSVGGGQYGRGYDPAEISGDHGIAGKLELRYNGPQSDLVRDWQLYGFWDGGRVWQANPPAGTRETSDLASAGVGARVTIDDRTSATAELAAPLTRGVASAGDDNANDMRGYFGLVVRY